MELIKEYIFTLYVVTSINVYVAVVLLQSYCYIKLFDKPCC